MTKAEFRKACKRVGATFEIDTDLEAIFVKAPEGMVFVDSGLSYIDFYHHFYTMPEAYADLAEDIKAGCE